MSPFLKVRVLGKEETWVHTPGLYTEAQFEAARTISMKDGFEEFVCNPFVPDPSWEAKETFLLMYFVKGAVECVEVFPDGSFKPHAGGPVRMTIQIAFTGTEEEARAAAEMTVDKLNGILGKRKDGNPALELVSWQKMDDEARA